MLNIRANSVLKSPLNATLLSVTKATRIVTIDTNYIKQNDGSTVESIVGFGEGTIGQRQFNMGSTLPKPKFKSDDGNYIDLSQSYLGTQAFNSVALSDPIIFAYIIKVNDWYDESIKPDWLNAASQRIFSVGSNTNQRHYLSLMQTGVSIKEGPVNGANFLIPETPSDWFAQVVYFNGIESRVVNSKGQILNSGGTETRPRNVALVYIIKT